MPVVPYCTRKNGPPQNDFVSPASVPEAHQRVFQEGREVGWADCRDSNDACHAWSLQNECVKNPSFM